AVWSLADDEVLITILKEQKDAGFQTDNGGFHSDAYKAATEKLVTSTSKGAMKTAEMCKTRWCTLKKEFKDVKFILSVSGFGWDAERGMATATNSVWEDLLKKKPKLKCWKKKCFPYYNQIFDLVEGQVATGATAFFPGESVSTSISPSASQTPAQQSWSATSSMSSVPSTLRKRSAITRDSNDRPLKRAHGRKPTQSDAGFEMAEAVRDLARSAMGDGSDPSVLSPARKTRAIACLEQDDQLSDNEMIDAFKLIRRETSVADTYLAIGSIARRTRFIQAELSAALNDKF
ncbi:Myb/SANT-like DNA-binding domain-containing protein, partial [Lentinula detonsa]